MQPTTRNQKIRCGLWLITTWLGVAMIAQTCVCIELLNAACGGLLPRQLPTNGANPKWRVLYVPEKAWLRQRAKELGRETLARSELSLEEQQTLDQFVEREELEYSLRDWVEGRGLLQYFACPLVLLGGVRCLFYRWPRRWLAVVTGVVAIITAAACQWIAWERAYFTSLGW